MKQLTRDEKHILRSVEKGEWRSVKNLDQEKKRYASYAKAMVKKDQRINIRISQVDLEGIQAKAVQEGIPYQTLIASILHKYVSGRLVEG